MRSFKPTGLLATLTAGLLVLAMVLGAFAGNTAVVRFEHSHEEGHHDHDGHHNESKHEDPSDIPHDDHAPDDDSHHHHLIVQGSPAICVPDSAVRIVVFSIPGHSGFPFSPSCPDGPYFELIKPPQIG